MSPPKTTVPPELEGLPAAESMVRGVEDLIAGRVSNEAYLVAMAASRLRELGLAVPPSAQLPEEPELALYHALGSQCDDPYGRYNSLRRELDSFISTLQARRGWERRRATAQDSKSVP